MQFPSDDHEHMTIRGVKNVTHDGVAARATIMCRNYETDIEDLWNAISDPERIGRWMRPISGELRLGGHYQLKDNAHGTINECIPPRRFAATWEYGAQLSWIIVELEKLGADRTRLNLRHIAPSTAQSNDFWGRFGPGGAGIGWDLTLLILGLHLSSGGLVDPAQADAWIPSAEGQRFIASISDAWVETSIAYGTAVEAAREAGANAAAFYTGEMPRER
ncbi:SRPBCC domain-containing protein [Sphingopyxis sp. MWB1]|uniref:SRPBCC domain-containing protein n=1 Tax=Sphingopyxis sp. MWB1 TaxID=1537715 RepID=UPI0006903C36|nr:SRPBCC domain-containing protein [Sphingopyxis sp. MWB1]